MPNGETASRDWLLYSPSTGKIFCFYCTLFEYPNPNTAAFSEKGFDDWKHPETLYQHEKCSGHFESIKVFKLWEMKNGLVDTQQLLLLQQEEHYWEAVIVRVIECVRYLAERGQPFRGDSHEIGTSAAESCTAAVLFFSIVAEIYRFFAASPCRWDVMKGKLSKKGLVVKKLSDTRWSARHDAIKAIIKSEGAIKDALEELASDEEQTPTTRHEAGSISEKIDSLEFAFMVLFWYDLLDRIHKTNLSLQTIDISLSCVVDLINSLQSFVSDLRNRNQFNKYLDNAKSFSDSTYQEFKGEITRRKKRRKLRTKAWPTMFSYLVRIGFMSIPFLLSLTASRVN